MSNELLPLFPLEVVLFPRAPLPLHIFEERYKELIGEALRRETEFGVVLARDKGILNVGCSATVDRVLERYPDGRLDILTSGRRRFEIVSVDTERVFLRAEVQFFDDEVFQEPPEDTVKRAVDSYREFCNLTNTSPVDYKDGDPQLSFLFAQAVSDLDFRQVLIRMRNEVERLAYVADFLRDSTTKLRAQITVRRLAGRNGHGQRPPSI